MSRYGNNGFINSVSMNENDLQRFWDKVDVTPYCWEWTSQLRGGYGLFALKGKITSAHRVSYVHFNGPTDSPVIRHLCDNRKCVNPQHLIVGTHKDNSQDMMIRDRHGSPVTKDMVEEIRAMPMSETIVEDVCEKYGLSPDTTRRILNGSSFGHLPGSREIVKQRRKVRVLSEEDIRSIQESLKKPYHGINRHLAKKYGVTDGLISHIKNGIRR